MRVLVTGASGFIGGHVWRLLDQSPHDVVGFDRAPPGPVASQIPGNTRLIRGDVTDPTDVFAAVATVDPDCIIHLAAVLVPASRRDPRSAFAVNVGGTLTVLEAATALAVPRVIAGSSINVYGNGPPGSETITESTPRNPNSTYAVTKYLSESIGSTYDTEFAALETVHGFGPDRIRGNAYDAAVVKAAVAGIPIAVPRTGIRDEFLYVEDSARAFVEAATADTIAYDRYIVGTDQRASLREIVDLVTERVPDAALTVTDAHTEAQWAGDRNNHPPTDSSRIRRDIGWSPRYALSDMIDTYVTWLEEHPTSWSFSTTDLPWGTS